LRPAQLKYLETIGLSGFDPSISPQINPKIIAAECHVPFQWRLGGFHFRYMSCQDVRDFVLQAAADGAYRVWTSVSYNMKDAATVEKVHVFIETGKEVEALLAEGKTLADIAARVSDTGREKFWDHWPE